MHIISIGGEKCSACCCYAYECNCGGILHMEVVDEWYTGDDYGWIHNFKCDKCGKEEISDKDGPIPKFKTEGT